jgi:hypothetical protein
VIERVEAAHQLAALSHEDRLEQGVAGGKQSLEQ